MHICLFSIHSFKSARFLIQASNRHCFDVVRIQLPQIHGKSHRYLPFFPSMRLSRLENAKKFQRTQQHPASWLPVATYRSGQCVKQYWIINAITWKLLPCGKIKYLLGRDRTLGTSGSILASWESIEPVQRISQFRQPTRRESCR